MSEEDEILKETLINEEFLVNEEENKPADIILPEELLANKIKEEKKKKKKKRNRRFLYLGLILLFIFLIKWGIQPFQSSIEYGICKTFLELNVSYPTTLHVNELNVLSDGTYRLWFSQVDPFGASRTDSFQCNFAQNPETGQLALTKVKIGTLFLDKQKIEYFNTAIPYLVANPPDLTYPMPLSDNIANLQFDTSAFTNIRNLAQHLPAM